jgi:hypothetical protein
LVALLLTLALFAFWALLGYAILSALRRLDDPLPNLLLAPVVGIAATLLPALVLNRAGLPIARVGWPTALALLGTAAALLWRYRPGLCWRRYAPFAGVLLLGLYLTGRPALELGLHWLSYCNDDMGNYSLMAHRLLEHGFHDAPAEAGLVNGTDYQQFYWFLHVPRMARSGGDVLLAWALSLTGLTAHQAFMPVILAFHLALISATGALACPTGERRGAALLTCGLLALSSLTTLGCLYQFAGQVLGLALLVSCTTVLLRPLAGLGRADLVRHGCLLGLLVAGQLPSYPEICPFLAVAFAAHLGLAWWRRQLALGPTAGALAVAGLITGVLLNTSLRAPLFWLSHQANAPDWLDLFPYYLAPNGLATLWGLQPFAGAAISEPRASALIVVGGVLLLASAVAALVLAWRLQPAAIMTSVMLAVGALLLCQRNGFGLFKLAMFIQPFLLATVVLAWFGLVRRPVLRLVPLVLLGLAGLPGQNTYVRSSRDVGFLLVELPGASRSNLLGQFRQEMAGKPIRRLLSDTSNYPFAKFQALYTGGIATAFPCIPWFQDMRYPGMDREGLLAPPGQALGLAYLKALNGVNRHRQFHLHDPGQPGAVNDFDLNSIGRPAQQGQGGDYLAQCGPGLSALNHQHFPPGEHRAILVRPLAEVANHLLFIPSRLGRHHFMCDTSEKTVGLFSPEGDYFFPGKTFAGCGRHVLFEVINPSPRARLLLSCTASVKGDGVNRLPPASAVGERRQLLPLVGRGSARVFSPPLRPQWIDGRAYVALDMGQEGVRPPDVRHGLMKLWGRDLAADWRYITVHARDVSLISEEEYNRLTPPCRLDRFPLDLAHPGLEYSGMYEDGWVSEAALFGLHQPGPEADLVVRGSVPRLPGRPDLRQELRVLVDGTEVVRRPLPPGEFTLRCPAPAGAGRRRVELRFADHAPLPPGDGRPVAAQLFEVGFDPRSGERAHSR